MQEVMRAAVLHRPGEITIESVPRPEVGPNEALVRVVGCGVCGSDIPRMLIKGAHKLPLICGHEFSGRIAALGSGMDEWKEGELVAVPPLIQCFKCAQCLIGEPSRCEDYDYFGSRRDGAYAEYVNVPASNLLRVPEGSDPTAVALADPAAIALHAIGKTNLTLGQRVAVVGCGPIGLFAIQWARLMGASEILAVDISDRKIAMAKEAGATQGAADSSSTSRYGRFDVVIEAAGNTPAFNAAVQLVGPGGRAVFIGIPTALLEEVEKLAPCSSGLLTLDYWMGNRTPYRDAKLRGAIMGLSLFHDRACMYRSAMESVALGTQNVVDSFETQGVPLDHVVVAGGIRNNQVWLKTLVDVLGRPVHLTVDANLSILAGAIAGSFGLGLFPTLEKASKAVVKYERMLEPNKQRHEIYAEGLERYRRATDALTPILHELAASDKGNPNAKGFSPSVV
jgi:L-iditol 2-dehydrogenase